MPNTASKYPAGTEAPAHEGSFYIFTQKVIDFAVEPEYFYKEKYRKLNAKYHF